MNGKVYPTCDGIVNYVQRNIIYNMYCKELCEVNDITSRNSRVYKLIYCT